jgi:hypothetical protein
MVATIYTFSDILQSEIPLREIACRSGSQSLHLINAHPRQISRLNLHPLPNPPIPRLTSELFNQLRLLRSSVASRVYIWYSAPRRVALAAIDCHPLSHMRRKIIIVLWIIVACVTEFASSLGVLKAIEHFDSKLIITITKAVPDILFLTMIVIVGPLVAMG